MNGLRDAEAEGGFATIEIIVAFVILASGLVIALEALSLASHSVVAADRLRNDRLELRRSALSREAGPIEPVAGFRP